MNIHIRTCVQSLRHQHANMISDGRALVSGRLDNVLLKVKPSLHQAFSQVVDVLNSFIHALLYNTQIK